MLDFLVDHLLLRNRIYDRSGYPRLTVGTVVYGALLRGFITIVGGFIIWQFWGVEISIPVMLIVLWGYVTYPAYRQLVLFSNRSHEMEDDLLCTRCRHFNASGHYCNLHDEYVRQDYLPCNGLDWEPSE